MITINNEQIKDISVVYKTWSKGCRKYTSEKGTVIWLGGNCKLGDNCELGNGCKLGYDCELGDGCKLGYSCKLDGWCKLGDGCKLGDWCELGDGCESNYPLWFCGIKYSIGFYKAGYIASGCIIKPARWWEDNIKRCAEENNYTPEQVKEYQWRVKTLVDWMKVHDLYASKRGQIDE